MKYDAHIYIQNWQLNREFSEQVGSVSVVMDRLVDVLYCLSVCLHLTLPDLPVITL